MANSIGGEARNQFRRRDKCIEPAMMSTYLAWLAQLRGLGESKRIRSEEGKLGSKRMSRRKEVRISVGRDATGDVVSYAG